MINLLGHDVSAFYIISQIFALAALLLDLYAFQRRKKVHLLNYNTVATLCSTLHYVFLGAWSGVASKSISTIRDATAAYEAHKHKTSKILPIVFVTLYVIMGIISFESPLTLLPVAASIIYTITIYIANVSVIRYVAVITSTLWLIYDIFVFSIVGVAAEAIFIFDDFIAIYRYRKKHNPKSRTKVKSRKPKR